MLTEEKLQKLLDDLRLGKYDNDRYEITDYRLTDKQTGATFKILFNVREKTIKTWYGKLKRLTDLPEYYITLKYSDFNSETCQVSKELQNSFYSYFTELKEKDKLIERLNIKESFWS